MGYSFIVSKARGPGDELLALGSSARYAHARCVTLDRLDHQNGAQWWERRARFPNDPKVFGLRNKEYRTWMKRAPAVINPEDTLELLDLPPEGPNGEWTSWRDDNVAGPYNALVSFQDWEQKINILGRGPYKPGSHVAMWEWSGGAVNELWHFWDATPAPRAGAIIELTNFEHFVQLGAHPDGFVYMTSRREAYERWAVEDAGAGQFYLRSVHGTYLGSRGNGEVYLTRNRDTWERWLITFDSGFRVRSAQWQLHLGARPDGSIYTHTNRAQWERWWAPIVGAT